MGWAYCGTDDQGRDIGYGIEATCDQPDCEATIDRGLAYVCGSMHGGGVHGCGRYFCSNHLWMPMPFEAPAGESEQLCGPCTAEYEASPAGQEVGGHE